MTPKIKFVQRILTMWGTEFDFNSYASGSISNNCIHIKSNNIISDKSVQHSDVTMSIIHLFFYLFTVIHLHTSFGRSNSIISISHALS